MWMRTLLGLLSASLLASSASATILENGQLRLNPYPGQARPLNCGIDKAAWRTYEPDAEEISYKGRWDEKHISWWSAPGVKFAFTGQKLALSFGNHTVDGVLVAYRLGGQDWQFANVTANQSYQFVGPWTTGVNLTESTAKKTFELRPSPKMVEIIGDSLSAGQYATYEGISSWSYLFAAGLGNVEYHLTAYPGICLHDQNCWGNPRGQTYQWYHTSDTSSRATEIYGDNPPKWDFTSQQPADLVVINIGNNDYNVADKVSSTDFYNDYVKLVGDIHRIWPEAQIVLMSLWGGFGAIGDTYIQGPIFVNEIKNVYKFYQRKGAKFVHYFDTTGILQHNDIAPQWHPTDVGHIKVAAHLIQWVKLTLGWEMEATGPMVHSGTLYWNDQQNY
ncbi:SGNH hydrolase-type esterase domain-containing protein [Aspergillus pseudoustus]|uniref:SGNH hydrolase-type esterase domain-containing protein n=1 Tax=Aspergillus pseudoustus TaxID=1810923 RepID=A0ABR4JIZ3_9EURO